MPTPDPPDKLTRALWDDTLDLLRRLKPYGGRICHDVSEGLKFAFPAPLPPAIAAELEAKADAVRLMIRYLNEGEAKP